MNRIRARDRVQSVINAAARLTTGAHRYEHVTPLMRDLHWLCVPERITYKLCVLVYNCLHGTAPRYLQDVIKPVAVTSRRYLRSTSSPEDHKIDQFICFSDDFVKY